MTLVIDASAVAGLTFPDERPQFAGVLTTAMSGETIAPKIFWYEIRATALKKERRGLLSRGSVDTALALIRELAITTIDFDDDRLALQLARRHALSFYDASYLALALNERAQLATLDTRLAAAARAEGVLLEP